MRRSVSSHPLPLTSHLLTPSLSTFVLCYRRAAAGTGQAAPSAGMVGYVTPSCSR